MRGLCLLLCFFLVGCDQQAAPASQNHPWPTAFHDNQRTNASDLPAPERPVLLWRTQIAPLSGTRHIVSIPMVAAGNIAYVVSNKTTLHRVLPNGSIGWAVAVPKMSYRQAVTVASDGDVVIGGESLVCVTPQGKVRELDGRDIHIGSLIQAEHEFFAPLALPDGSLLTYGTRGMSGKLSPNGFETELEYRLPSGKRQWIDRRSGLTVQPVAWDDGITCFTDYLDGIVVLDKSGKVTATNKSVTWRFPQALWPGGVIAASKDRKTVYWLDSALNVQQQASLATENAHSRAVATDGTLYLSTQADVSPSNPKPPSSSIRAYDGKAQPEWKVDYALGHAGLSLAGGTLLAVFPDDDTIRALNAASGKELWSFKVPGCVGYTTVGEGRTIYVVDRTGGLSAIGDKLQP